MLTKEVQLRFCKGYIQIVTGLTVGFDMIVADWREYNQSRRYTGLWGLQILLFTTTCKEMRSR